MTGKEERLASVEETLEVSPVSLLKADDMTEKKEQLASVEETLKIDKYEEEVLAFPSWWIDEYGTVNGRTKLNQVLEEEMVQGEEGTTKISTNENEITGDENQNEVTHVEAENEQVTVEENQDEETHEEVVNEQATIEEPLKEKRVRF
ncbi:hypothetical protein L1987_49143 [Smallanthus sonchifolius]|uniref:Uncharacterized protein n=1 Tax=Smallanthus sonchifolius TaxID=185202 RepID=A0ACB9FTP5_9ASTR|nr:hypothetical protein L1987_49143 [Smallanthus sonchifolius]